MRETDIQKEMIDGFVELGGWAKKMTNRFTVGIPDLLVVVPPRVLGRPGGSNTFVVEVKTIEAMPVRPLDVVKFKHNLTMLQNYTIMEILKAGGMAGWIAVYRRSREDQLFAGHTLGDMPTRQEFEDRCVRRLRGNTLRERWSVVLPQMLARIASPAKI